MVAAVSFTVSVILWTVDFNAVETILVSTVYFGVVVTSRIVCVKEGEVVFSLAVITFLVVMS